jgi:ATPase family associated with various cellular activities (AAA)
MYIEIDKTFFDTHILSTFAEDSYIVQEGKGTLRYGSTEYKLNALHTPLEELNTLYDIAKEQKNKSLMRKITPIRNVIEDVDTNVVTSLKALPVGIAQYLKNNVIDGWLYHIDDKEGIPNPYLVRSVSYHEARNYDDRPSVSITLVANSKNKNSKGLHERRLSFDSDDIQKRTVAEILGKLNFYRESKELKELYNEHIRLFEEYQPQMNKQFNIEGGMETDNSFSNRLDMPKARAVNDEEVLRRSFTNYADSFFWEEQGVIGKFNTVPFHSYVYLYHLDIHTNVWVHVTNMTPYEYDTSLRDKLILPQSHRDLIDILVNDMDILQEDIIKGKSGGTTILCEGKAGLGKTLSAEVYSEVVQRPLYKVHSGQLGLRADEVENSLEKILKRASRWGAILLIDEADVYIRRRGDDLHHNAVVASFLRTLEYFSGLLFMTTNRGDDVDDAIQSRCIAVIKYETPTPDNAKKIWRVLTDQFGVEMSDGLIDELVERFPNASGRDIKELLKLSSRFARGKNIPLDIEVFRQCSQFRGLRMN